MQRPGKHLRMLAVHFTEVWEVPEPKHQTLNRGNGEPLSLSLLCFFGSTQRHLMLSHVSWVKSLGMFRLWAFTDEVWYATFRFQESQANIQTGFRV